MYLKKIRSFYTLFSAAAIMGGGQFCNTFPFYYYGQMI
jgi:hypothetical protein